MSAGKRAAVIEPFAHFAPTGEGWAEGLEENGWEVERRKPGGYVAEVDLVVLMDTPGPVKTGVISGPKIAVVVSDTPNFPIAEFSEHVDLFISHTLRHNSLDSLFEHFGAKLHHLPLAGRRMMAKAGPADPLYDVCFVGSYWHGNRGGSEFLSPFLANGMTSFVSGCEGRPPIPYQDLPSVYSRSKIGLNFHYPYQKSATQVELNARTFDLALAGCFQVTDNPAAAPLLPGVAVAMPPTGRKRCIITSPSPHFAPVWPKWLAEKPRSTTHGARGWENS